MAFRIRASHIVALAITVGIAGWMATGGIEIGGKKENGDSAAPPIAAREEERSAELFKVRFVPLLPETREEALLVRGRTEADATIPIRAETGGILKQRFFEKGEPVKPGDVVCEIDKAWREAKVAQAQAKLAQAESDYESNAALSNKGFSSDAQLRQMKAALEAARAVLAEEKTDLERTRVRANATGIVQDPIAEAGDILKAGDVCITLIDTDPMLFVGQVSERNIKTVEKDMKARIELVSGETLDGTVTYISPSADPQTRTFRVEIAMDNPDGRIRDGITANARISLAPQTAFRVSPSWISLADDGRIGLKMVDQNDRVQFVPVEITAQTKQGFWVTGPEPGARVITVGHEYVINGEAVQPVADPVVGASLESGEEAQNGDETQ